MEKDEGTPVKSKIMKRQTDVNTKMKLRKARQTILKHNQKVTNTKRKCDHKVKVHSVPKQRRKKKKK